LRTIGRRCPQGHHHHWCRNRALTNGVCVAGTCRATWDCAAAIAAAAQLPAHHRDQNARRPGRSTGAWRPVLPVDQPRRHCSPVRACRARVTAKPQQIGRQHSLVRPATGHPEGESSQTPSAPRAAACTTQRARPRRHLPPCRLLRPPDWKKRRLLHHRVRDRHCPHRGGGESRQRSEALHSTRTSAATARPWPGANRAGAAGSGHTIAPVGRPSHHPARGYRHPRNGAVCQTQLPPMRIAGRHRAGADCRAGPQLRPAAAGSHRADAHDAASARCTTREPDASR
jgi:hypothetical protein